MATYTYPYPSHTANRAANWIAYEGRDLLQYFTPRGDPNPVYDRFVGYLDVDWNAVNRETVEEPTDLVPVEETIETVAPVAPVVSVPTPAANEPSRQRDGNDLVLVYSNGSQERYRNYFAPTAGTVNTPVTIQPNPNAFLKPVASERQVGNDRQITFVDGSQKILGNFYLPHLPNPEAYGDGKYMFGTGTTDPEYMVSKGVRPPLKWLSTDFIQGADRVAIYSDGSALRIAGWVNQNPSVSVSTPTSETILDDTDVIDYVTPEDLFTPGDGSTEVTTPATSGASNTSQPISVQNFPVLPQVLPGPGNVNVPAVAPDYTILALALTALSLVR